LPAGEAAKQDCRSAVVYVIANPQLRAWAAAASQVARSNLTRNASAQQPFGEELELDEIR